jgi:hypothetical protein
MTANRTIQLPDHGTEGRLWAAVLDVADAQPNGWTLIGALMVMLHAHDHGLDARRTTRDADALVDVRGIAQATRRLVATLERLGWQLHPDHPKADDIGFRFAKDGLLFDVLAPEGLGQRTDLTTLPPLKTVPMTGGSRAAAPHHHPRCRARRSSRTPPRTGPPRCTRHQVPRSHHRSRRHSRPRSPTRATPGGPRRPLRLRHRPPRPRG